MRVWIWIGAFCTLGFAQSFVSMGARLLLNRSQWISPTDAGSSLVAFDRTHKAGIAAFFTWGWSAYVGTGFEIAYQGVGQRFYGIGANTDPYRAEVNQQSLRLGLAVQPQYAQENWGLWASVAPGFTFLTQTELVYQGDSLASGSLTSPQIIQQVIRYLDQSTDPNDRLLLNRMYRRAVPVIHLAGGLRVRIAPQVWVLGLLSYERSFGDLERKGYRLSEESPPLYDLQRGPVRYQLLGLQLGIQYEVPLRD